MLFRQIQYFITVVDCSSFTEAAEQCYISQSAISQQIQALERDLGTPLLRREGRRFSLTPAGTYFYEHCRRILDEVRTLRRETIRRGQDEEWRLRIGYLRSYSGLDLSRAVADFSCSYPEVCLSIVTGTHEELYDMIRTNAVDLIINDQRRAFSDEYANFELSQCPCYAEVSAHSGMAAQEFIRLDSLQGQTCILISSPEQQEMEKEYYAHTLGFNTTFLFAETIEAGRLMAAGNCGFLPIEGIGTLPPPGDTVCRLPLYRGSEPLLRNYCVFWRKEKTNYYIEEFARIFYGLVAQPKQYSPDGVK